MFMHTSIFKNPASNYLRANIAIVINWAVHVRGDKPVF